MMDIMPPPIILSPRLLASQLGLGKRSSSEALQRLLNVHPLSFDFIAGSHYVEGDKASIISNSYWA